MHGYVEHYEKHFASIRDRVQNVLEIGVKKGESLRLWKEFFPNAHIYGIDIALHCQPEERISLFKADQSSISDLKKFLNKVNVEFDIIIDDGGHSMGQQQTSLKILYPHVKGDGFYVIEDLHTSDRKFTQRISGKHIWGADLMNVTTTLEALTNIKSGFSMETEFIDQGTMNTITTTTEYINIIECNKNIQNKYNYVSKIAFLKKKQ